MFPKKRKLGRGLSALLGDITFTDIENQINKKDENLHLSAANPSLYTASINILEIPINDIAPNPHQPRKSFNEEAIHELAESIKKNGILQPILVQKDNDNKYSIIAGERRYRAAKLVGLTSMPCIVKNFSEAETFIVAMIENIQRSNLNPIEEALGYKTICDAYNVSHTEIANLLGKSRTHVANMVGILSMPQEIQDMIASGEISIGHAKVLKKIADKKNVSEIAKKIKDENLSVRALEKHIEEIVDLNHQQDQINHSSHNAKIDSIIKDGNPEWKAAPQEILAMEDAFNAQFEQLIHIQHTVNDSGKVVIHYSDINELRQIMSKLIDLSDIYAK